MKTLLTRKTIIIAAIAVLIAIVTIVSVNAFGSSGPITGLANAITRPFRSLALSVARTFESIYSSIYRYDTLYADYEEVLGELITSQRANRESDDLLREYNELRALFGFRERHAGLEFEEAVVRNWSSANWSSSFTISKGYANSDTPIARGNSVITEYGVLIGQITEVSATTSTVVTVIDTTFSAGVSIGNSGGIATAKGEFTLMGSGLLMLDHISEDLVVLPGDSVVTSATGGVFPVGLVIGEIVEVHRHGTGIGRYATIRPMRVIDDTIVKVYVVTSFDISGSFEIAG